MSTESTTPVKTPGDGVHTVDLRCPEAVPDECLPGNRERVEGQGEQAVNRKPHVGCGEFGGAQAGGGDHGDDEGDAQTQSA
jgi:hypothetical protein